MATNAEVKAFIQLLGGLAVAECNRRIAAGKGFPLPSVCIAQSALETGWGTAGLMTRANAFFGIKAGGSWTGKIYTGDTWEVVDGERYNTVANFRAYDSLEQSVADYFDLIGNNSRYSNSLSYGKDKSQWKTPYECIHAIWSGGYATDDVYVPQIMNMINGRNLTDYDALVTGEGTPPLGEGPMTGLPIIGGQTVPVSLYVKGSSMVQGSLMIIDSGRAVENNREDMTAVSTDWSKAISPHALTQYSLEYDQSKYNLDMVVLSGDVATMTEFRAPADLGAGEGWGVVVTFNVGDKVGFTLRRVDGQNITPDNVKNIEILLSAGNLPAGAEVYSSGIAHFIRVE